MPYIYGGALYCDKCGRSIIEELEAEGKSDEYGDAENWPQYSDEDSLCSDCPDHCDCGAECFDALEFNGIKVGAWIGNDLTEHGRAYVAVVRGPVGDFWRDVYSVPFILRDRSERAGRKARRPRRRGCYTIGRFDVQRIAERMARMGW